MTKDFFLQCINIEVYGPYKEYVSRRLTVLDRIKCRYFSPETNVVFLIRKMQYYNDKSFYKKIISRLIHNKLIRQYGIFVNPSCVIGLGLRIYHPTAIVMTNAIIGENFTIYQNCTVGQKYAGKAGSGLVPRIGNNCSMYANSSIIGNVNVSDDVIIGAHACLVEDAKEPGLYLGVPAKKKS